MLQKVAILKDGYFNYTITSDQIDADGKITVDCDLLAEYMEAQMQEGLNWSPRNFKAFRHLLVHAALQNRNFLKQNAYNAKRRFS